MRGMFVKFRILCVFLCSAVESWRREIWSRDLDELYCCDGRECGCGGKTVRDIFGPAAKEEGK